MISKIRNNLYLSSAKDVIERDLKALGVDVVLNVAIEVNNSKLNGITDIKLGFRDSYKNIEDSKVAIDKLIELLNNGNTVLVHCRAGRSRSPHVVASALSILENKDYYQIYDEIIEVRPEVLNYSLQREYENSSLFFKIIDKRNR